MENQPHSLLEQGLQYAEDGEYETAIDCFSSLIKDFPEYSEAYGERGRLYRFLGMLDKSISDFRAEVKLSPSNPESHMDLGISLAKNGEHLSAICSFSDVIALNPSAADAFRYRARSKEQVGDVSGAQIDLQDFLLLKGGKQVPPSLGSFVELPLKIYLLKITKWYLIVIAAWMLLASIWYALLWGNQTNFSGGIIWTPPWLGGSGASELIQFFLKIYILIFLVSLAIKTPRGRGIFSRFCIVLGSVLILLSFLGSFGAMLFGAPMLFVGFILYKFESK